jgi:protein ImuB
MRRRERVASSRRALVALPGVQPAAASLQRSKISPALPAPSPSSSSSPELPLTLPLESLFDVAPESWMALQIQAAPSSIDLERLARLAGDFTSRVSLEPPDAVLLEVQGSFQLFGGASSLCRVLLERCVAAGIEVRWALAPTPLAALALARAEQGVIVLARDRLIGLLSPLPLTVLRWPAVTLERLESIGARTLGAVLRLPRAGFARRFGREALLALDRLTGTAPEPRRAFLVRERFRARVDPGFELSSVQGVLSYLEPVLGELEDFLRTRQSGIELLMLRLHHRAMDPTRVTLRLATAELQARRFSELLALQMSRLVLPAPVTLCELRSGALRAFVAHSAPLWRPGEHGGGATRQSTALIERLRARLGSEAVYGLCLVPEHRPESAWRVTDVLAARSSPYVTSPTGTPTAVMARRPLWLLHEPEVLPWALEHLRLIDGPERIETGWWDGREIARDYYVARDESGAELWVYRERLSPHGWYLHGVFG